MPKKVMFDTPKEFLVNDEKLTEEQLDKQVNPYLVSSKLANPLAKIAPSPKELAQDIGQTPKLVRVGRPLRHVKHKPTKEITFVNNQIFPKGANYSKIKFPLKPNTMIIHVKYFAINPIDIKIWNYYTADLTGANKGFGREFSGEVYQVADNMDGSLSYNPNAKDFKPGDHVCGLYYHLFAKGCSASHILVDLTKDPIALIDQVTYNIFNDQKLAGWCYNFLTAFQVLNSITAGGLNSESTILINGASTSTGLMTMQILKNYFHVSNIVGICSGTAAPLAQKCGASVIVDYKKEADVIKSLAELLSNGKKTILDRFGNEIEVLYPDKKFDLVIDFLGGEKILKANKQLMNEKTSTYLTIVGPKKADYKSKNFVWKNDSLSVLGNYVPWGGPGVYYKYVAFNNGDVKGMNKLLRTGVEMIKQGQMVVEINSVFDFNHINKAMDKVKTQHALGKVLIECEDF
ncbi:Ast1 protein [Saccharomycopsis crataegensis]|uniref:Ast1 protein n=1 Tax=Saccharomycopsis crataegensis TaxID=43959 RepID=A0AAV5QLX2_9ASCO|nr:Ast1 protein [Saccharomycopsis crataegensis]